jgi:glucosamine-6-phosphate deaminase
MDLLNTISGSLMEGFFPAGWDLKKIDGCVDPDPRSITKRQRWWHRGFEPVLCASYADFDTMMGHEIALTIRRSREAGEKLALILPVGPMGMYRWTVYFLTEWGIPCDHVWGFNMDEWSDSKGNTLPPTNPGAFQYAMQQAFYGPLGKLTVPVKQRHFATKKVLPGYADRLGELRAAGAKLTVIFGIGCRLEARDASAGRPAASPDDRAECNHQLQEPHNARPGVCKHDRTGAVSES